MLGPNKEELKAGTDRDTGRKARVWNKAWGAPLQRKIRLSDIRGEGFREIVFLLFIAFNLLPYSYAMFLLSKWIKWFWFSTNGTTKMFSLNLYTFNYFYPRTVKMKQPQLLDEVTFWHYLNECHSIPFLRFKKTNHHLWTHSRRCWTSEKLQLVETETQPTYLSKVTFWKYQPRKLSHHRITTAKPRAQLYL